MSLTMPLPGGVRTQPFGVSHMAIQPSMWYRGTEKAWWSAFPGASGWSPNVHAGVDFAGRPAGSALVAAESGTVTRADYDRYQGGGWVVEVEIRPGVRYSYNHCQYLAAYVGKKVARGQKIAAVGATGTIWTGSQFVRSSYGVHVHALLTFSERHSDGITRPMLHDFADFMAGGARAGSSLIRPAGVPDTSTSTTVPRADGAPPAMRFRARNMAKTLKAGKPIRNGASIRSTTLTKTVGEQSVRVIGEMKRTGSYDPWYVYAYYLGNGHAFCYSPGVDFK